MNGYLKKGLRIKHNKIKDLMEKQQLDTKQGLHYRCGITLESDTMPN